LIERLLDLLKERREAGKAVTNSKFIEIIKDEKRMCSNNERQKDIKRPYRIRSICDAGDQW